LIWISQTAHADRYISCIQAQLNEIGFDAGKIDGRFGNKTRSAIGKYKQNNPELKRLPKLTVANASVYCRAIGLERKNRLV